MVDPFQKTVKQRRASVYLAYGKNTEGEVSLKGGTKKLFEASKESFDDVFEMIPDMSRRGKAQNAAHGQKRLSDHPPGQSPGHPSDQSSDHQIVPLPPCSKASRPMEFQLSDWSSGHPPIQSPGKPPSPDHPSGQLPDHSPGHLPNQSSDLPSGIIFPVEHDFDTLPELTISEKQSTILYYLCTRRRNFTNRKIISKATHIAHGTVKDSISVLKEKGFLKSTKVKRHGTTSGFEYFLNLELCEAYFRRNSGNSFSPLNQPFDQPPDQSSNRSSDRPMPSFSSSSFSEKTTTENAGFFETAKGHTENAEIETIRNILEKHPELGYWRQKKLTPKQIFSWMKSSGNSLDTMVQYLCYCRFEMIELEFEKNKSIRNVFNWFFRLLERTGGYPKPNGYRSFEEKKIEEKREIIQANRTRIEELKALARKEQEQAKEEGFWEMMANPKSDQYQRCFEKLSAFHQKRAKKGGRAFEDAMRKEFEIEWEKD